MNLPVHPTGPTENTGNRPDEFANLAQMLAARSALTLVYAPSTTTITNPAPAASPALLEVRVPAPAGPPAQVATAPPGSWFTRGEVVAYSGATLMGGATLSGLISTLLAVPMLVPLLSGVTALAGLLAAIGGAMLDSHEREGARR